jgi:hypothetical protein
MSNVAFIEIERNKVSLKKAQPDKIENCSMLCLMSLFKDGNGKVQVTVHAPEHRLSRILHAIIVMVNFEFRYFFR